jgi:hypothetical protein
VPHLRGIQHPKSKLTEEAVRDIRASYRPGWVSYRDLAERYNVSLQLVAKIVSYQAWSWVEDDGRPQQNSGALGLLFCAPDQVEAE